MTFEHLAEMDLIELLCFIPALWHCGTRIRAEYRHRLSESIWGPALIWFPIRYQLSSAYFSDDPSFAPIWKRFWENCAVKRTWNHYFATLVSTPAYLMILIRPERVPRKAVSTPGSTLQDTPDIVLLWVHFLIILTAFYLRIFTTQDFNFQLDMSTLTDVNNLNTSFNSHLGCFYFGWTDPLSLL